jgi:hypothetical protein
MNEDKPSEKQLEMLYSLLRDRLGNHLTAEELEQVKKDIQTITEACKALGTVKLCNCNEPFSVFKPYRGRK